MGLLKDSGVTHGRGEYNPTPKEKCSMHNLLLWGGWAAMLAFAPSRPSPPQ